MKFSDYLKENKKSMEEGSSSAAVLSTKIEKQVNHLIKEYGAEEALRRVASMAGPNMFDQYYQAIFN